MTRKIEMYSEITGGVKRCNIDLMVNGHVADRCSEEGYTHAGVDEYAQRDALRMAEAYGIPMTDVTDRSDVGWTGFVALACR